MGEHACPACGRPVDPLRAGSVAILGGTFRYFCNQDCKAQHLAGQNAFSDRTAAPPRVEPVRDVVAPSPRPALPTAPIEVPVAERAHAPEAYDGTEEEVAPFALPDPPSKEPPTPIALFGIALALVTVVLALLGARMMAVRLPLVVLSAVVTLGFLGLSPSVRSRPLPLLLAQVLPLVSVPILAALTEFAKRPEHPLLASADAMTTLGAFISLSILTTEYCARLALGRLAREVAAVATKLPDTARVLEGARELRVAIGDVTPGSVLRVRAGERVPIDGTVVAKSEAERIVVRANTVPIEVTVKDEVLAGFLVESGFLDVRTTQTGTRRWFSIIAERANGAPESQVSAVRSLGHAMGRSGEATLAHLVPAGLLVAALSFAAAAYAVGARGVELFAAGAAGFACVSVTAVFVSIRLSTRYGFLRAFHSGVTFQDSASFARLGAADTALLCGSDGILCDDPLVVAVEGAHKKSSEPSARGSRVKDAASEPARPGRSKPPEATSKGKVSETPPPAAVSSPFEGGDRLLSLAGSAQAYVGDDPTANAIRAIFTDRSLPNHPLRSCEVFPGLGVVGVLGTGERLVVGSRALFLQEHISVAGAEGGALPSGRKNVYVALDGRLQGTVVLDAAPRVVAAVAMQRLQSRHVEPVLLSYESREVAESVASAVGIEHVRPCTSEEEALREVDALVEVGRIVSVVGMPERDEALFERAHVGLAMRACGQPFRAWSVATMSSDPRTITAAFEESLRLRDAHRRSFAIALGPGAVALFAALFGLVPIFLPALFAMTGGLVALYRASLE